MDHGQGQGHRVPSVLSFVSLLDLWFHAIGLLGFKGAVAGFKGAVATGCVGPTVGLNKTGVK